MTRILVVDDEAHIVQVLSLKLRSAGFEVETATDGEEAIALALARRPDLVVTDFQMPYMTGLELCRALAAEPSLADVPVIILTARGYALDDDDRTSSDNIKRVLGKPFSPRAIVQLVNEMLGEREAA